MIRIRAKTQTMFTLNNRIKEKTLCGGFTLFEVIVTLSLIVVLSSIVYVSGNYGLENRALGRASSDMGLMLKAARVEAILSGRDSRLIINIDETDSDRFLRYVGIMTRDDNDPTLWVASHSGIFLPESIYVVPQTTTGVVFGNWDESVSARKSRYRCQAGEATLALANIEYPEISPVADNIGQEWIVYQFSPDGRLDAADSPSCSSGPASNNNQVVLAPAELDGSGNLVFNDSDKVRGLVLRQNGVAVEIEDPVDFL